MDIVRVHEIIIWIPSYIELFPRNINKKELCSVKGEVITRTTLVNQIKMNYYRKKVIYTANKAG